MFEKNKKSFFGFTLTELLIALTIIGAIAGLTIPSLMEGLQKKMLVTELKNDIASIQQLANNQLIYNKTKDLLDTDFNDPNKLLVEKNFPIVRKCNTAADCWSERYKVISNSAVSSRYKEGNPKSVILKNGAILSYSLAGSSYPKLPNGDQAVGIFYMDVNGIDKPNVIGRDVFWFLISKKGKVMNYNEAMGTAYNEASAIAGCKNESFITGCLSVIMENNWTMPY